MNLRTENKMLWEQIGSQARWLIACAAVAILTIFSCLAFAVWEFSQPKGTLSCASFGSFEEAQRACPSNPQLDRDHDGICCEQLLSKVSSSGL